MAIQVSLRDIVDAMDLPNSNWQSYLNRDTGQIVTVTDEGALIPEDVEDFESETLSNVDEVLESDRYLPLPSSFEIHEWSIMERFARSRRRADQQDELLDSLHGRGAFRMFRATIRRFGLEDAWERFRDESFEQIAKDWLDAHGIPFK